MCLVKNKIICNKYALKEQEVQLNLIKKLRFHNSFRERASLVLMCMLPRYYNKKPNLLTPKRILQPIFSLYKVMANTYAITVA